MSIEYRLRTPIANTSGLALPSLTAWLSSGNRFGPFGSLAPGIVYVVPMPGTLPGLAIGLMRSSLPSQAFVLPEVWRASANEIVPPPGVVLRLARTTPPTGTVGLGLELV